MATTIAFDQEITDNGQYIFPQLPPGCMAAVAIDGTNFGSGTVTLCYVSLLGNVNPVIDAFGAFVTTTVSNAWEVRVPPTGKLAIVLSGATSPSLKFSACIASN